MCIHEIAHEICVISVGDMVTDIMGTFVFSSLHAEWGKCQISVK